MFSHGLHSSLCSPTEFTEYTEPSCCMFSHRLHRFSQNLLAVYSPTEFTEYTEPSCCIFSHGLHRFSQNLLAVCSPTEFTERTEPSCCIFSHRLHRFSQMLLSGGALVSSAPTRSVVALLALLVHLRQVHPLERTYLCRSVKSVGEYFQQPLP